MSRDVVSGKVNRMRRCLTGEFFGATSSVNGILGFFFSVGRSVKGSTSLAVPLLLTAVHGEKLTAESCVRSVQSF